MRRAERRQTIHLNCSNRGRLRKVQHHRQYPKQEETALLLTPNHLVVNLTTSREARQRPFFFLRKQELRGRSSEHYAQQANSEDSSQTFRAIHTASPYHSLRKVPLRSVTPLKDRRKDYPLSQKVRRYSPQAEAGMLREQFLSMKLREMKYAQLGRTAEAVTEAQQKFPRYAEYADSQEFYQYRQRRSPLPVRQEEQERHRIAGTRIEPFKKYQIREVHKSGYSQCNYQYPLIISQQ